jgi:hypothetical protein
MAKTLKNTSIVLAVFLLIVISYYSLLVVDYRRQTAELFAAALGNQPQLSLSGDLNDWQMNAFLVVQDPDFFSHGGTNFSGGTMTTITQALAKSLYFDDFKPGLAKIKQSLLARFALDPVISKDDQLSLFLSSVYLGRAAGDVQVSGFRQGAQAFYGKSIKELTREEFLSLLAALPAPNRLNPFVSPEQNTRRTREIAALLAGRCEPAGLLRSQHPDCSVD